jgi:predicted aminopeptidase
MIKTLKYLLFVSIALALQGCANLGYYLQVAGGHLEVLAKSRPIGDFIEDPDTDPELRRKLKLVLESREFAIHKLDLPDNGSYLTYADLKRAFAVWNVFATPELSLEPKTWCFMIIGCVSYRGYFDHGRATAFAGALREQGYDVYVGGATAYSTLGWFSDPVLNTVLKRSDAEITGVLFHELAHQRLYVKNDSAFNESFAVTVELEGVRRWLSHHQASEKFELYRRNMTRREDFIALILKFREQLARVYNSPLGDTTKREQKAITFDRLREDYQTLKQAWGGYNGYDAWFSQNLNNAQIASVGTYHQYVGAFQQLLSHHNGDLTAFYAAAAELARLPDEARQSALEALAANVTLVKSVNRR